MLPELGLTVLRQIPVEYLGGLLTGAYSLHGGVIRDSGGRILAHLVSGGATDALLELVPGASSISSAIANGQLYYIGRDVAAIKSQLSSAVTIASGAAALSGLGLVVSIAGFAFMHARLSAVDRQLAEVAKTVKRIERLISTERLAALRAAIDSLHHAERSKDADIQRALLLQAKSGFANLAHYYGDLWLEPPENDLAVLNLLDDCYTLSFAGNAIATSELRLHDVAASEFKRHLHDWLKASRAHLRKQLLEDDVVLFFDKPVNLISTGELIQLMDFAEGERRGINWVDDLRQRRSNLPSPTNWLRDFGASIRLGRKLLARAEVAEAEAAHLSFLADKGLSVSAFLRHVEQERDRQQAKALCILPDGAAIAAARPAG